MPFDLFNQYFPTIAVDATRIGHAACVPTRVLGGRERFRRTVWRRSGLRLSLRELRRGEARVGFPIAALRRGWEPRKFSTKWMRA